MIEKKEREETWLKNLHFQEKRLRDISDSMKRSNVRIINIPEGVEKKKGLQEIFEQTVAENFPNLAKEPSIRVQEAKRTPPKINDNRLHHVTS